VRFAGNPIVTPAMVAPSRPDLRVVGAFNPAVALHEGETILMLRVAEAPRDVGADEVAAPVFDPASGQLRIERWRRDDARVDARDARFVRVGPATFLTSISHLRRARSLDGLRFEVDAAPTLAAATDVESFGVEDARLSRVGDVYWMNYTAVSRWGIATAAATSTDLRAFERRGVLFAPPNRDVTIFPEALGGRFVALHRPMPEGLGESAIWIATSTDLLQWGSHRPLAGPRPGRWDDLKVGGGAPPLRVTVRGRSAWLCVYHGVRAEPLTYALGALLLDGDDPSRVLGRSSEPILAPEAPYERTGFFGRVVFSCGVLLEGDRLRVYYGAADETTAVADLSLDTVLAGLD
jgi:predicted GH43/DUF377 family glycosyl hydrolase